MSMDILIDYSYFWLMGGLSSALAHDGLAHCVPGITLSPGDAKFTFITRLGFCLGGKEGPCLAGKRDIQN